MAEAIVRPENAKKVVDSLGRVTLPKGLRDRMYINSDNNELEIFTIELDGKTYIALASPDRIDNRYFAAREVFIEMGVPVPEELERRIEEMCGGSK